MPLQNNDPTIDQNIARKVSDPVDNPMNTGSKQRNINNDGADLKARQTTEDLKARLRELLARRFLT
jgi:hypothetical protein